MKWILLPELEVKQNLCIKKQDGQLTERILPYSLSELSVLLLADSVFSI